LGNVLNQKRVIDPLYGSIPMPLWLVHVLDREEIRRMMFIRQLGLKAYIDFPGAIHTRYSHALGTMHVAGRIVDLLCQKATSKGHTNIAQCLKENKNTLMAAGFFHDIGHGPFSHVLDYPLKKFTEKSHEEIAADMIVTFKPELERFSIPVDFMTEIIRGIHEYNFICGIINGPLDADKLDYLLRDSYHVGLKYSFDVDIFINEYVVLGNDSNLSACELGLESNPGAIDTAEIYLLIWKSLYDIVYYAPWSRVAEKMLEKAILRACEEKTDFKEIFLKREKYAELTDSELLSELKTACDFSKEIVERILKGKNMIYGILFSDELKEPDYKITKLLERFHSQEDVDEFSDEITIKLCDELKIDPYHCICDIIRLKVPGEIHLNENNKKTEEPLSLSEKSSIVKALEEEKIELKVYVHPDVNEKIDTERVKNIIKILIDEGIT